MTHIPWTLSWVNRSFCHLVIGTPAFWSNIDIMLGERRVALSLERCGTVPLDVTASLPPIILHQADNRELIRSFMNKVSPLADRIRSLRMVYTSSSYLETAVALMPTSMPELESLDIGIANRAGALAVGELPAHLTGKVVSCRPINFSLRANPVWAVQQDIFSRVKTFEYRAPSCKEADRRITRVQFLSWLRKMPHLETLVLEYIHHVVQGLERTLSGAEEKPIMLANLCDVRLDGVLGRDLFASWAKIDTPSLEVVTVRFIQPPGREASGNNEACCNWLQTVAERSPQLRTLDITNWDTSIFGWGELFRQTPSLVQLRLASCNLCWGLEEALKSGNPPAPSACPKLQYLVVDNELDMTSSTLRSVVKTRMDSWRGVSPIRWLVVRGVARGYMDNADVQWSRKSVDGLLIEHLDANTAGTDGYDGRGDWDSEGEGERDEDDDGEASDTESDESDAGSLASGDLDVVRVSEAGK